MKFVKTSCCALMFTWVVLYGIAPLCFAETESGKTSIEEVKQETQEVIQAVKGYTADQRDEAIRKTKAALASLDKRIDNLETRIDNNWNEMDKAAREKARASLRALRKQRTQAAEWYGSLKSSSADAWGHMKKGFSDAYKALYDAWEKSVKEFGSYK